MDRWAFLYTYCSKCGVVVFDDNKGDVLGHKARKETKESTRGVAEVTCRISRDST
jgi:hypothetical protein